MQDPIFVPSVFLFLSPNLLWNRNVPVCTFLFINCDMWVFHPKQAAPSHVFGFCSDISPLHAYLDPCLPSLTSVSLLHLSFTFYMNSGLCCWISSSLWISDLSHVILTFQGAGSHTLFVAIHLSSAAESGDWCSWGKPPSAVCVFDDT